MEKTLTSCLIKMRDDLSQLRHIRECLDSNPDSQYQSGGCSISWRTIEAFNMSLAACKEKNIQELNVIRTILDSFHYVSSHNNEENIWKNFGFELGLICVKFLAIIEQSEIFEELFCKLLSTIDIICQHTSDPWKAIGRQILNIFINKKLSVTSLEAGLKVYVSILQKLDISILSDFTQQNFHLVKTFFKTTRRAGDIEIQMNIIKAVFFHVRSDKNLLENFIVEVEPEIKQLFQNLSLVNFKEECRIYLNNMNTGLEDNKKVHSLNCKKIILGSCTLEPPYGKKSFWLDANDATKRLSTRCLDFQKEPSQDRLILIQFKNLTSIQIEMQPESLFKIVLNVKNLNEILPMAKTDLMICTTIASQDSYNNTLLEFTNYLKKHIKKTSFNDNNLPKSCDRILVNNNKSLEENSRPTDNPIKLTKIDDHEKIGINRIVPDALTLLSKIENEGIIQRTTIKKKTKSDEHNEKYEQNRSPNYDFEGEKSKEKSVIQNSSKNNSESNVSPEPEELSPNSFIESLNKNLGLDTPTISSSYEGSLLPMSFEQNSPEKNCHKLFKESDNVFEFSDRQSQSMEIDRHQLMSPKTGFKDQVQDSLNVTKTYTNLQKISTPDTPATKCLELSDTQSDNCFYNETSKKRKPRMPRLKNQIIKNQKKKITRRSKKECLSKTKSNEQMETQISEKPSLLDPNGYAYKRWLEPTTSARSAFWLKKIEHLDEGKRKFAEVFEFPDDSDLECQSSNKRNKNSTQRNKNCRKNMKKPKNQQKEKKPNLKLQKQIKNRSKIKYEPVNPTVKNNRMEVDNRNLIEAENCQKESITIGSNDQNLQLIAGSLKEASENYIEDSLKDEKKNMVKTSKIFTSDSPTVHDPKDLTHYSYENLIIERSSSFESVLNYSAVDEENVNKNIITASDFMEETEEISVNEFNVYLPHENDEVELSEVEDSFYSQKRHFYAEDDYSIEESTKKKIKRNSNKSVASGLQSRIKKSQTKIKQETDEIIQVFSSATFRLINHVHKKNALNLVSYMKKAEKTCLELAACDFQEKMEKLEKLYFYYKNKCSVLNVFDSSIAHLSFIKNALENWAKNDNLTLTVIENYNNRLEGLIEKEIDDLITQETESFRQRFLHYSSFFNENSDD